MEEVANAAASAFDDFSGAFGGSNAGIFGTNAYSFADVANAFDGMEGNEVGGSLPGALGDVAGSSASTFANVASAAANIPAGAAGLGLRGRRRGLLLLGVGACAEEGCDGEDEDGKKNAADKGTHAAKPPADWMQPGAWGWQDGVGMGGRNRRGIPNNGCKASGIDLCCR
jgi:hypothetical protein